jgi:peptide/nickel transport system substrate-binding protein
MLVVGVVLAVVAGACGGSDERGDGDGDDGPGSTDEVGASEEIGDEGEPVDGGVLLVGIDSETSGWNPAIDRWAPSGALVGSTVLEPLATLDADAAAQPWLATGWEPNDTNDVWTVELREGVTFHDGSDFDADAVKLNLDFVRAAPLSGVAMGPLFDEVVVVDDHTVEIRLTTPWAAFPSSFLAGQSAFMRSPDSMETDDKGSSHPVGTGPFVFDQWRPDDSFKARRNPDYWVEGQPHLEGIEFQVIPDSASRAAALEAVDIDMMFTSSAADANSLQDSHTVLRNWGVEPAALLTNVRPTVGGNPNPMSNLHARLALAHAIDRETIASTLGEGVEVPTSPFSPDNPWGQPSEDNGYPDFDLEQAEAEVAAYLEDTGEDALRVVILGPADTARAGTLQLVEEQVEAAGIEVEIQKMEQSTLISSVVSSRFQVALFSNYSSPDPDQNHYFWSKDTASEEGGISINFTGFTNDVTEAALRQGRESSSFDERHEAYSTLVEELNANAVNLWLYYAPYSLVASPRVKGLKAVSEVPFANFQPKTWLGGLWLADA